MNRKRRGQERILSADNFLLVFLLSFFRPSIVSSLIRGEIDTKYFSKDISSSQESIKKCCNTQRPVDSTKINESSGERPQVWKMCQSGLASLTTVDDYGSFSNVKRDVSALIINHVWIFNLLHFLWHIILNDRTNWFYFLHSFTTVFFLPWFLFLTSPLNHFEVEWLENFAWIIIPELIVCDEQLCVISCKS